MKRDPKIDALYKKIRDLRTQILFLEYSSPSFLYYISEYGPEDGRKRQAKHVAFLKRQITVRKNKIKKLKETIQELKTSHR